MTVKVSCEKIVGRHAGAYANTLESGCIISLALPGSIVETIGRLGVMNDGSQNNEYLEIHIPTNLPQKAVGPLRATKRQVPGKKRNSLGWIEPNSAPLKRNNLSSCHICI